MAMISVQDLTFGYDGAAELLFEHVSFQIDSDWRLGFVGRNGRGKTTFLQLLLGRYEYRGTISAPMRFDYFPFPVEDDWASGLEIAERVCPDIPAWKLQREAGLLELEERMNDLKMTMNQEKWEVTGKGDLYASSPALRFSHNDNGEISLDSFDLNREKIAPAGYGGALDLGFTWNVIHDLTVSAAVLDLGAIYWIRNFVAHTAESGYSWTPSDKPIDPMGSDVQRELDRMGNALSGLFRFKDAGAGSAVKMLPWRMNIGAEYRMPFYDRLSVGALYTGRMGDIFSRHTGRFSVNWNPADFFSLSTSTALSNFGESIGFAMNLHPGGINLMVGCDYIPFRVVNVSPLFKNMPEKYKKISVVPANHMKMNLFVALHIAVGERRLDHTRRIDW